MARRLLSWLNEYPTKPAVIQYEYLEDDQSGMALSLIQGVYKTRRYITGGYQAACQFKIIYRLQAAGNNTRLAADETLNALADWAATRQDRPDLGGGRTVTRIVSDSRSALFGRYENGDEDHQILMTMNYEVI